MKLIHIIWFILLVYNTHSQQNLPVEFEEEEAVKWAELEWMEGNSIKDQRFIYRVPPIIIKDTMYFFTNYRGLFDNNISAGYCGYSIKKLNKNTGEKYWEVQRQYKEFRNRKAISQPHMRADRLVVTLFDEAPPRVGNGTDWDRCYPAHIVIDRGSGKVIDSNYVNKQEDNLPFFHATFEIGTFGYSRGSKFYFRDSLYLHRTYWSPIKSYIDTKIDFEGKIISIDTIKQNWNYPPLHIRSYDIDDKHFYSISIGQSNDWKNKEFLFHKYDQDLNLIKSVDISKHIDIEAPVTAANNITIYNNYFVLRWSRQTRDPKMLEIFLYLFK